MVKEFLRKAASQVVIEDRIIPFPAYTPAETSDVFQWAEQLPVPMGNLDPYLIIHVSLADAIHLSKRHLNRFSRFLQGS